MDKLRDLLVKNVMTALEEQKISQIEFARRAGMSPQSANQYLKKHASPGLAVIERFAKALGKPVYWLFKDQDASEADITPEEALAVLARAIKKKTSQN